MSKNILAIFFLSLSCVVSAQDSDYAQDSVYVDYGDDSLHYEVENFTRNYSLNDPSLLPVTQDNNKIDYSKKEFNKSEWKKITGGTNFTEEKKDKEKEKLQTGNPVWNAALLKIISYVIIFVLIIVILYFVIKGTLSDGAVNKKVRDASSLLYDDHHIDDVTEQDIEKLLKKALDTNDFRAAVRLYYIRLLKHLHTVNLISWKKDKTNRDYAIELARTLFIADFKQLTLAYEIIWYGERTISTEEFKLLENNFNSLHLITTIQDEKE